MRHAVVESFRELREQKRRIRVYESSVTEKDDHVFLLVRENLERKLVILRPFLRKDPHREFAADETGKFESEGEVFGYQVCLCDGRNAQALRRFFPFTAPKVAGLAPAIGTGDRIGLATPAHIRAVEELPAFPVLAQQSIREMNRTQRTPAEVLDDVSWAVFQEGYLEGFAADADHLKTLQDIDATFQAGYTMYTIDPSDYVDNKASSYDRDTLEKKFDELPWDELECTKEDYFDTYLWKKAGIHLSEEGEVPEFSEEALLRAAVKYSPAIAHTAGMYRHLEGLFGEEKFDLEMSVDESVTPTSPLEHFFIGSELKRLGVHITGLAPRFVGRFEKAIDYIGDLKQFEESLKKHVLIAKLCGPYKLSIHSGSDKFSIYPVAGRLASDMIHLKTAGTSYLEALRVVARHDPPLFREIVKYSLERFEEDRKSYHISTDLSLVPDPDAVPDGDVETVFLNDSNGRQLIHITYGSILTAKKTDEEWLFRERIREILIENEEEHYGTVAKHIRNHIESIWGSRKRNKPVV
jgi:hypothetical protein